MNDIKALFLAILMDKYADCTEKFKNVSDNEGIDKDLVAGYLAQVKTDLSYMQLSLQAKLEHNVGAKAELEVFFETISMGVKELQHKELDSYLG